MGQGGQGGMIKRIFNRGIEGVSRMIEYIDIMT